MENRFERELTLYPKPSRYLAVFIMLVHGLVAGVALITPAFPFWVRATMAGVVLLSAYRAWRLQIARREARSIVALRCLSDGSWQIQTALMPDIWQEASLQTSSFGGRYGFVLNFKQPPLGHVSCILLLDSVTPEVMQTLRMRWAGLRSPQ